MAELIGVVLVVSVLGMLVGTLLKGILRILAFAVLAALAVSAVGEPISGEFPALSNLFQNFQDFVEIQPLPEEGSAGGAGGVQDDPFTDAPTSQSFGTQPSGQAGGTGGANDTTAFPRPRTDSTPPRRTQPPVTGMW